MIWSNFLYVGLGGMLGSVLRYWVGCLIPATWFPMGTLTVNLIGSFVMGALTGLAAKSHLSPTLLLLLGTGLCGGFTTFSTFSNEVLILIQSAKWTTVIGYVIASVLGGLVFAWLGYIFFK